MAFGVVCISSQDGADAEEISGFVSEALGFRLINEEILTRAAVEAGVDRDFVSDIERRKSVMSKLLESIGPTGMASAGVMMIPEDHPYGGRAGDELRAAIRTAIEDTASAGGVVIVAHAAALALVGRDDVLRVHITASDRTRQRRVCASLGIEDDEASKLIKRSDAGRADYLKRFYGIGAEHPTHYDLVINTDRLTANAASRVIIDAVAGAS